MATYRDNTSRKQTPMSVRPACVVMHAMGAIGAKLFTFGKFAPESPPST